MCGWDGKPNKVYLAAYSAILSIRESLSYNRIVHNNTFSGMNVVPPIPDKMFVFIIQVSF